MGIRSTTVTGTSKRTTLIRVCAVVVAFALAALVVLQRSDSAFSGQTQYDAAKLGTGTVALSNTPASTALNVTDMIPGDRVTSCVMVHYTGNVEEARLLSVRGYGSYATADNGLASYLDTSISVGAAGATCASFTAVGGAQTGTMASLISNHGNYSSGIDTGWRPSAGDRARAFRFVVTLPSNTDNAAQGKTVQPVVTWEVRSGAGSDR